MSGFIYVCMHAVSSCDVRMYVDRICPHVRPETAGIVTSCHGRLDDVLRCVFCLYVGLCAGLCICVWAQALVLRMCFVCICA